MAELCVKQGLTGRGRRDLPPPRRRDQRRGQAQAYEARIGALAHPADEPSDVTPMETPELRVDRRGDEVEIEWRLPAGRGRARAADAGAAPHARRDHRRAAHGAADLDGGTDHAGRPRRCTRCASPPAACTTAASSRSCGRRYWKFRVTWNAPLVTTAVRGSEAIVFSVAVNVPSMTSPIAGAAAVTVTLQLRPVGAQGRRPASSNSAIQSGGHALMPTLLVT